MNLFLKITILSLIQIGDIKNLEQAFNIHPLYACIYMGYMDIQFLKNDQMQPWIWVRYFVDIFFIRTAGDKELGDLLE